MEKNISKKIWTLLCFGGIKSPSRSNFGGLNALVEKERPKVGGNAFRGVQRGVQRGVSDGAVSVLNEEWKWFIFIFILIFISIFIFIIIIFNIIFTVIFIIIVITIIIHLLHDQHNHHSHDFQMVTMFFFVIHHELKENTWVLLGSESSQGFTVILASLSTFLSHLIFFEGL